VSDQLPFAISAAFINYSVVRDI